MTFSLVLTHLVVVFKALVRDSSKHFWKIKEVCIRMTCSFKVSAAPPTSITLPQPDLCVCLRYLPLFFCNVYPFAFYGCQAAWYVVL